jgi:hypothetical protein
MAVQGGSARGICVLGKDADGDEETLWGALIARAERRKRGGKRSLSLLVDGEGEEEGRRSRKDEAGNVQVDTVDPTLLESQPHSTCQQAVEAFKGLVSRRRYRKGKGKVLGEGDDLEGFAPLVRVQSRRGLSCSV